MFAAQQSLPLYKITLTSSCLPGSDTVLEVAGAGGQAQPRVTVEEEVTISVEGEISSISTSSPSSTAPFSMYIPTRQEGGPAKPVVVAHVYLHSVFNQDSYNVASAVGTSVTAWVKHYTGIDTP